MDGDVLVGKDIVVNIYIYKNMILAVVTSTFQMNCTTVSCICYVQSSKRHFLIAGIYLSLKNLHVSTSWIQGAGTGTNRSTEEQNTEHKYKEWTEQEQERTVTYTESTKTTGMERGV